MFNSQGILWKWFIHGVNIFNKFDKDRTKNVEFLQMTNFWACLIFFYQDFTCSSKYVLNMFHDNYHIFPPILNNRSGNRNYNNRGTTCFIRSGNASTHSAIVARAWLDKYFLSVWTIFQGKKSLCQNVSKYIFVSIEIKKKSK